jgi:hypothetical protein
MSDDNQVLFNLEKALDLLSSHFREPKIYLVNSTSDCMKLSGVIDNVVAINGKEISPQQLDLLKKHFGIIIVIQTNEKISTKSILVLVEHFLVRLIYIPNIESLSERKLLENLYGAQQV